MKIRNMDQLAATGDVDSRRVVLEIAEKTLQALDSYKLICNLMELDGDVLKIGRHNWDLSKKGRIYIVGAGKACNAMARAIDKIVGQRITSGICIVKVLEPDDTLKFIELTVGGHAYPNEDGMNATKRILDLVDKAGPEDLFIGLFSGGSSALMNCPLDGITLDDEITITKQLITSGARILEINAVRRHISRVNGGRLAEKVEAKGAEMINLIISDLVGDEMVGTPREPVSSAGTPVGTDPTTFAQALEVLGKYKLMNEAPGSIVEAIKRGTPETETPKSFGPKIKNFLIQGVRDACEEAMKAAASMDLTSHVVTSFLEGDTREAGVFLGCLVKEIKSSGRPFAPPCVLIAVGETVTNTTNSAGMGGPSQELSLGFAEEIAGLEGVSIIAIDTDGTDGPTELAGGVTDSTTLKRAEDAGFKVYETLDKHDSYTLLKAIGDDLFTGNTGTNLCDLNIIYVS